MWKEIGRVEREAASKRDLELTKRDVKNIEEKVGEHGEKLARVDTNVEYLVKAEEKRFGKIVAVITLIVTIVTFAVQGGFHWLSHK